MAQNLKSSGTWNSDMPKKSHKVNPWSEMLLRPILRMNLSLKLWKKGKNSWYSGAIPHTANITGTMQGKWSVNMKMDFITGQHTQGRTDD